MQSIINAPISFIISFSVLFGWLISDFRLCDAVNAIEVPSINRSSYLVNGAVLSPATSSPNIDTNWFSVSSSGFSNQLPSAQARKDDNDNRIAQGRIMGDSFGSGGDL